MKKLILAAFALTTAAGVFAQGTIVFNNNLSGDRTHIWGANATTPSTALVGRAPNDNPAGVTSYAGMTLIGTTLSGQWGANSTFAQLIGAAGFNQPEASLVPLGQISTFRSGSGAGLLPGITVTLSGTTPIAKDAPAATFEIVAWDNSGTIKYPTWAEAEVAWKAGLIAAGKSPAFNVSAIGGDFNVPPSLNNMGIGTSLTSFNLYMLTTIPEPSMFALAGLGAAVVMIFRRRK